MYAEIIINSDALDIDKLFTYKIPYEFQERIDIGFRVKLPFGPKNKPIEGFVFSILRDTSIKFDYKVKEILTLCDKEAMLTKNDIEIIKFMRKKYLCRYIDAIRLMIPVGIMKGSKEKRKRLYILIKK